MSMKVVDKLWTKVVDKLWTKVVDKTAVVDKFLL